MAADRFQAAPPRRGPYLLTVDMLGGCLFSI